MVLTGQFSAASRVFSTVSPSRFTASELVSVWASHCESEDEMREKLVHNTKSTAGGAFPRIAARVDGADVPLMDLEPKTGFFSRLKEMVGMNGGAYAHA